VVALVKGVLRGKIYDPVELLKRVQRGDCPHTMRVVAYTMYPHFFEDVEQGRCPICGRRYASRGKVWSHIRRTQCSFGASAIASSIYREWATATDMIYVKDGKYVVRSTGRQYDSFEEAYRAVRDLDVIIL